MHKSLENFLSKAEEQEIIEAIITAEQNTSGEIRVHLERKVKGKLAEHAYQVFCSLDMKKTKQRNGVLLYIAVEDKCFYIYGDEGINAVVAPDFWDSTKDIILSGFKEGAFKNAIVGGVLEVGKQLKKFFPYDRVNDINELPDEISKGI